MHLIRITRFRGLFRGPGPERLGTRGGAACGTQGAGATQPLAEASAAILWSESRAAKEEAKGSARLKGVQTPESHLLSTVQPFLSLVLKLRSPSRTEERVGGVLPDLRERGGLGDLAAKQSVASRAPRDAMSGGIATTVKRDAARPTLPITCWVGVGVPSGSAPRRAAVQNGLPLEENPRAALANEIPLAGDPEEEASWHPRRAALDGPTAAKEARETWRPGTRMGFCWSKLLGAELRGASCASGRHTLNS